MLLTIAIPAHNKSHYLRQAIFSIIKEREFGINVDLVISDNSLNNDVKNLITEEFKGNTNIKLFNSKKYKCLDSNVNRSVELASGEYVWIFGDDDLIIPGVISEIVDFLNKNRPLIVVLNSKSFRGNKIIEESRLPEGIQNIYEVDEDDKFLSNMAGYLTYVGGILVKRKNWLEHYDKSKIGSFFAHIVCITSIKKKNVAYYFSNPAIKMRLGSQTWTNKSFLIWHKFYPEIIWGLKNYSDKAKKNVINLNPMSSIKTMIASKSYGRLDYYNFKKYVLPDNEIPIKNKFFIFLISIIPVKPLRLIYIFYILFFKKKHTIKFSPKLALAQLRD